MTNILLSIALCAVGASAFISGALFLDYSLSYEVEKHIVTYIV